jgi:hypothetical protein
MGMNGLYDLCPNTKLRLKPTKKAPFALWQAVRRHACFIPHRYAKKNTPDFGRVF